MLIKSISYLSILLVVVGLGGYFLSGQASPTALIPAGLGVLIYLADLVSRRSIGKMWLVVTGLIALVGAAGAARGLGGLFSGVTLASLSQSITFVVCVAILVSVALRWRLTRVME